MNDYLDFQIGDTYFVTTPLMAGLVIFAILLFFSLTIDIMRRKEISVLHKFYWIAFLIPMPFITGVVYLASRLIRNRVMQNN